jgi:hypothetical protein
MTAVKASRSTAATPATEQDGWKAVDVFVTYRSGAYVTNTVLGRRASSTCGPEFAARKLADKLFGENGGLVRDTSEGTTFTRRYRCAGWLGGKVQDGPQAEA